MRPHLCVRNQVHMVSLWWRLGSCAVRPEDAACRGGRVTASQLQAGSCRSLRWALLWVVLQQMCMLRTSTQEPG